MTKADTPIGAAKGETAVSNTATIAGDREAFAHAALQCSPDCLKVLDTNGNVLFFNANGLCAMEIDDIADVAGRPWPSFWPTEAAPLAHQAVASALEGEVGSFQSFCPTAKGTMKYWDVSVSAVPNPGGVTERLLVLSRDITAQYKEQQRRAALTTELGHRINNTLTLVQAIAQQSKRTATDLESFYEKFRLRLRAMSEASNFIVAGDWNGVLLHDLVRSQLGAFDAGAISVSGPNISIRPEQAQALALAINELATNATKYGALSVAEGRVTLHWTRETDKVRIEWRESGGPRVEAPGHTGLGSALIKSGIPDAHVDHLFDPGGVVCVIALPL